jgi:hypothetical protein
VQRDWELIEDAMFCIAKALEPGPVTLVYHDRAWRNGPMQQTLEEFSSTNEAIQRACAGMLGAMPQLVDHPSIGWTNVDGTRCATSGRGARAITALLALEALNRDGVPRAYCLLFCLIIGGRSASRRLRKPRR